MSRHLEPYQENPFIEIGRLINKEAYSRQRKEIEIQTPEQSGGMIIDLVKNEGDDVVVAEVKKSSRYENSARMQLAYYLMRLKMLGIKAKGELLFPKEKKRETIELTEEIELELIKAVDEIKRIIRQERAPEPRLINFCKKCGYQELCWC